MRKKSAYRYGEELLEQKNSKNLSVK